MYNVTANTDNNIIMEMVQNGSKYGKGPKGYEMDFFLTEKQKHIYYIVHSILFVFGTCGNCVVISIISMKNRRKTNFDIHIISLSVADLMASVFLPIIMIHDLATNYKHWYLLGDFGCKLFLPMPHINCLVSSLMLAVISVERFIIIKQTKLTPRPKKVTLGIVLVVWTIAIAIVSPYIHMLNVKRNICMDYWPKPLYRFVYFAVLQCMSCFGPMIVMVIVYTVSIYVLKHKKVPGNNRRLHARRQKRTQQMTQMFGIIVVIFFLMTTPYSISFFVLAYYGTFDHWTYFRNRDLIHNVLFATYTLMAFNACINPMVYSARYKELSKAIKTYMSTIAKKKQRKTGVVEHVHVNRKKRKTGVMVQEDVNKLLSNYNDVSI